MKETLCACGKPLHYTSAFAQRYIEQMSIDLGPCIKLCTDDGRCWMVQRHFIALHGIKADRLPVLAKRYGFKEVTNG